jgi:cyclophilin family peptidyl-prolyl cis-trans isomerase
MRALSYLWTSLVLAGSLYSLPVMAETVSTDMPTTPPPQSPIEKVLAALEKREGTRSMTTSSAHDKQPELFVIETTKGVIKGQLYTQEAPITTRNFIQLATDGFYNGLTFHRVEPGFVIQTGDPTATGTGGSKKTIPLEISPKLRHNAAGVLGMARTSDPNSATSQFYITLDKTAPLDDQYAVFGKVTEGLDVLQKIKRGDRVQSLSISPH